MKYLVPLARANKGHCDTMVKSLGKERLSDREVATLYTGWRQADATGKERIRDSPRLYLRAMAVEEAAKKAAKKNATKLVDELDIIGAMARRARRKLHRGGIDFEMKYKRIELKEAWRTTEASFNALAGTLTEILCVRRGYGTAQCDYYGAPDVVEVPNE